MIAMKSKKRSPHNKIPATSMDVLDYISEEGHCSLMHANIFTAEETTTTFLEQSLSYQSDTSPANFPTAVQGHKLIFQRCMVGMSWAWSRREVHPEVSHIQSTRYLQLSNQGQTHGLSFPSSSAPQRFVHVPVVTVKRGEYNSQIVDA